MGVNRIILTTVKTTLHHHFKDHFSRRFSSIMSIIKGKGTSNVNVVNLTECCLLSKSRLNSLLCFEVRLRSCFRNAFPCLECLGYFDVHVLDAL